MFLSKPDILAYVKDDKIRFDPPIKGLADADFQVSVDLRLGHEFTEFQTPAKRKHIPSVYIEPSIWGSADIWRHKEQDEHVLEPGCFVLARTMEEVSLPSDLLGLVEGRSSFARLGIAIHLTAPKIDPGFSGAITLEMMNVGRLSVTLRAGIDKPAQLMFAKVSTPLGRGDVYGTGEGDIFQYQKDPIPHQD